MERGRKLRKRGREERGIKREINGERKREGGSERDRWGDRQGESVILCDIMQMGLNLIKQQGSLVKASGHTIPALSTE